LRGEKKSGNAGILPASEAKIHQEKQQCRLEAGATHSSVLKATTGQKAIKNHPHPANLWEPASPLEWEEF